VARLGAVTHVLGHNEQRLERALTVLRRDVPQGSLVPEVCDIADLDDVRRFAAGFAGRVPRVHALAHNAGMMARRREETARHHERTLATHVLGPHLLTALLVDVLAGDGGARVVFQSSGGMYGARLRADDPEYHNGRYSGVRAYARTKRMQVVLAGLWAERLAPRGVAVHSTHPGWVDTSGVREHLPRFRAVTRSIIRTPAQGADTLVWLLAGNSRLDHTGGFWHDRRLRPTSHLVPAHDGPDQRELLWRFCVAATGEP
jgi:dehydrogenase/reductase SDR family member 12